MEFEPEKRVSVNTRLVLTGLGAIRRLKSSLDERCSPEGNARVTGTERDTRTPFLLGDDCELISVEDGAPVSDRHIQSSAIASKIEFTCTCVVEEVGTCWQLVALLKKMPFRNSRA